MQEKLSNKFGINRQIFISFFIVLSAIIYFSYYTISGNKGISKYFELRKELRDKNVVRNSLLNDKKNKQNMVDGMSLKSLDIDLLDEQARKNLGYAKGSEVIIYDE